MELLTFLNILGMIVSKTTTVGKSTVGMSWVSPDLCFLMHGR